MIDKLCGRLMQRKMKETLKDENSGEPQEWIERGEKMQEKVEKVKKKMGNGGKKDEKKRERRVRGH
jgi:hypothetical protein